MQIFRQLRFASEEILNGNLEMQIFVRISWKSSNESNIIILECAIIRYYQRTIIFYINLDQV